MSVGKLGTCMGRRFVTLVSVTKRVSYMVWYPGPVTPRKRACGPPRLHPPPARHIRNTVDPALRCTAASRQFYLPRFDNVTTFDAQLSCDVSLSQNVSKEPPNNFSTSRASSASVTCQPLSTNSVYFCTRTLLPAQRTHLWLGQRSQGVAVYIGHCVARRG